MLRLFRILVGLVVAAGVTAALAYVLVLPNLGQAKRTVEIDQLTGDPERGAYVLRMGGCVVCHTDTENGGVYLSGGAALQTPFGTFYGPNITSHPQQGVGGMSNQEFFDAMTAGQKANGEHYFPSFPYTSYAKLEPGDIVDLKAYLDSTEPADTPNKSHDLIWPFSDRILVGAWKEFQHSTEGFMADLEQTEQWNRGAYLVNGPGHCGECHSARNLIGGVTGAPLAGAGKSAFTPGAPAIAGAESTIKEWTVDDLVFYFEVGLTPDGDASGGKMNIVIEEGTGHLTSEDLTAMAVYLKSL